MKSRLAIILLLFSITANCQIPSAHLQLWLRADSGTVLSGNTVVQWQDVSGNGYVLSQLDSLSRPIKENSSALCEMPVLTFDGSDDYLDGGDILDFNTESHTVFLFGKSSSGIGCFFAKSNSTFTDSRYALLLSSGVLYFYYDDNTYHDHPLYGVPYSNYFYCTGLNNRINNKNKITVNNSYSSEVTITGSHNMASNYNFLIGGYNNSAGGVPPVGVFMLNGNIAEIIIYDTILNTTEISSVEEYLKNKYAPPANLGPDTAISHGFCPYRLSPGKGYTSYLWSTGSTADSIVVSQSGDYWVQVTDIFGRVSRDTVHVQYPYTALPDRGLCILDTITANTGLDHAYTFSWSDASSDSLLRIWNPGTYWVEITDSTLAACSVRDSFVVVADSFALQAGLGPDTSVCAGNSISLQTGSGPGLSYVWNTGATTPSLAVFSAGTYWLSVTNGSGCVKVDSIDVGIRGVRPVTVFSSTSACRGDSTSFFDASYTVPPDDISSWSWDFDGSGTSSLQHPSFVFPDSGHFQVTLTLTTDSGCVGDTTIEAVVRALPRAWFTPDNGCDGQTILFGDSTRPGSGPLAIWEWAFGDGDVSLLQHPGHTYDSTGTFEVTMIAGDIYGCTDTIKREITIRLTPEADFTHTNVCLGNQTSFVETTDMPAWAEIFYRRWEFGDGESSNGNNPVHTYDTAGNYNVRLINRSINGCSDSVTKVVSVYPFPIPGFSWSELCQGSPVCFQDTSTVGTGVMAYWEWNLGGGQSSALEAPCVIYEDTGEVIIHLRAGSEFGCFSEISDTIFINASPITDFDMTPEYGTPPLDVQFYNFSSGATSQMWYFGDDEFSGALNPQHTYIYENIYDVTLVSENEYGCTDTASRTVYVIPSVLDLVLTGLSVIDTGGYVNLKATFFNNGTRNIRKVALDARVGLNLPIREVWEGLLEPAQSYTYTFVSSFMAPDENTVKMACLDIAALDAYGQEDVNISNNTSCVSLLEAFFIATVFPSPAWDDVYTDISIPEDGDVVVSLMSQDGRILMTEERSDVEAGTLRIQFGVDLLASGVYYIQVRFEDKVETYKFVRSDQ